MGATLPLVTASKWLRHWALVSLSLLLFSACGNGGLTGPDASNLEILLVQGDGQAGEPGQMLSAPLEVRVQRINDKRGQEGVTVRWQLIAGQGAALDSPLSQTDSTGAASTRLTLGLAVGTYRVRASVAGMEAPPVEFSAEAILQPVLTQAPAGPVSPGEMIQLAGDHFSLIPEQNVVTFSGVRGKVVSATSGELRVEVPLCLPARSVQVRVQIGALSTVSFPVVVQGSPSSFLMAVGEDEVLDASEGMACVHLPSSPGSAYLVVPLSTGTVGGAEYGYSLVGLTGDGVESASPGGAPPPGPRSPLEHAEHLGFGAQQRWDERVRALEGRLVSAAQRSGGARQSAPGPAKVPAVGESRQFSVLNAEGTFDRVTARVKYVSSQAVIYLDDDAPSDGFTDFDLADLALEFDDPIHPTVTGAFGSESDLDGNGRVIILLTPAVNRLTEPGSDGYIGGFFFGLDLLRDMDGSNEGEIFYALVPDPTGQAGPPLTRSTVRGIIPAVLAHEFEHMVNFNLRMLVGAAASQGALWLSEALAQMAEDLVGEAFESRGQEAKADQYRVGNYRRARRFLQSPGQASILASLPPGTLAERGAGWLLLKQVFGQEGQNDLLRELAASTRTGVESFTVAVGRSWESLLADWAGSLYLDETGLPIRPELSVPGIDLKSALSRFDGRFPLVPMAQGGESFFRSGTLRSSAPAYFVVTPPSSGGVAVSASGPEGGPPASSMDLRVLVVRIH